MNKLFAAKSEDICGFLSLTQTVQNLVTLTLVQRSYI